MGHQHASHQHASHQHASHNHAPPVHGSPTATGAHRRSLATVLCITITVLIVDLIGSAVTGSLALLADAAHMAADAAGIGVALFAAWIASRPVSDSRTFGYYRAEILAAAVNAVLLFGISAFVLWEAAQRLRSPQDLNGAIMVAFGLAGVAGNGLSLFILRHKHATSLNIRGAFLEVLSDFVGALAVVIAGVLVLAFDFTRADAIASLFIALLIVPRTWKLLREAVDVLLEATPRGVTLDDVRTHIIEAPGVVDVHDLHVWTITSGMPVISAHVIVADGASHGEVLDHLAACLASHFDIEHSTFQLEPRGHQDHEAILHP